MLSKIKLCYYLLEIIEGQSNVIKNQNKAITRLVNENLEKENYISELMQKEEYLY